jgi:hypothetical protein
MVGDTHYQYTRQNNNKNNSYIFFLKKKQAAPQSIEYSSGKMQRQFFVSIIFDIQILICFSILENLPYTSRILNFIFFNTILSKYKLCIIYFLKNFAHYRICCLYYIPPLNSKFFSQKALGLSLSGLF